jgi:hypothetical protein
MEQSRLIRYSAPTRFDLAEYGTRWNQHLDDAQELWIQTSRDESNPLWMKMGNFLELVFAKELETEKFLKECLEKYK